jgi:hypothetical protein
MMPNGCGILPSVIRTGSCQKDGVPGNLDHRLLVWTDIKPQNLYNRINEIPIESLGVWKRS